jgi:hypothetical protein
MQQALLQLVQLLRPASDSALELGGSQGRCWVQCLLTATERMLLHNEGDCCIINQRVLSCVLGQVLPALQCMAGCLKHAGKGTLLLAGDEVFKPGWCSAAHCGLIRDAKSYSRNITG